MARAKRKRREQARRLHQEPIIRRVAEILATGTPTKWRWESACRRGVRAALCLKGWKWDVADDRASRIVSLALHRLGAGARPTWRVAALDERQQRVGEVEYQFCRRCGGRQEPGSSSPWCSRECWRGEREALRFVQSRRDDEIAAATRAAIFGAGVAPLPRGNRCRQCSKQFVPTGDRSQRYCSYRCFRAAGPRVPMKDCLVCASPFRGQSNARLYCSPACVAEGGRRKLMARRAGRREAGLAA